MPDRSGAIYEQGQTNPTLRAAVEDDELRTTSLLELAQTGPEGERKAAARIVRWWTDQNRLMHRMHQEWRVNKARRKGIGNVKLIKRDLDTHSYEIYAPPNVNVMPLGMNKADRLCRRINSFLFTDPPMPEATPPRDDDEARDAAETTTRVLQVVTSEGHLDDVRTARKAFDLACTYDSAFRHHYVDPAGGGRRPIEVQVHPQAQSLQQAVPQPLDPMGLPYTGPYVGKYVKLDGTLTDNRVDPEIRMQTIPGLRSEVLTGKQIRLLPATAEDIWEADGVLIGVFKRLGDLKRIFPKMAALSPEQQETLFRDPPPGVEKLMNEQERRELSQQELNDDATVFTLTHYRKSGGTEPTGVYAVVVGQQYLAHIQPWMNPKTQEPLDIPVDQIKQFEWEDSPYGRGLMRQLGGGNELLAIGYDAVITHMERLKNRRIFLPTNSIIQAKQLQSGTGTTIPVNPGGKPEYEDVPGMPAQYMQFIELIANDMNDESALQEVAQGMNTPSVESGLHARQIIEQSVVALSDLRQNTTRFLIRGYRIYIQLMKAFFSVPQMARFMGDDGNYKIVRWTGSDFGDTTDVRITKGSFTQLSPPAKAAEAERMFAMVDEQGNRLLSLQELKSLVLGNVGGLIGLQDDPFRNRVRRQLAVWERGPTPQFLIAFQQRQQMLQQLQAQLAGVPPEQAQQVLQQAQAQLPPLPTPFEPMPVDEEQPVAAIRHFELARYLCRMKAQRHPPPWMQVVYDEYLRARQAAGIATVAEQQMAAQQQQQAQDQQMEQQRQADSEARKDEMGAQLQAKEMETQGQVLTAREQARPQVKIALTGRDFLDAARGP